MYRKELGSAQCNQNFSSKSKPASFFLSFPFVLIFLYFLWLRLLGRGLWCSRDLHSKPPLLKENFAV